MHKVLEELAKVIGRAWAREWLDSLRERDSAIRQSNKSKSSVQDSAAEDAGVSWPEDQVQKGA